MQFIDHGFFCKHIVAVSFRKFLQRTSVNFLQISKKLCMEITEKEYELIFIYSVKDASATKISKYINLEEETCEMSYRKKIVRSAVGDLTHRKNGVVTNAFPAGYALLKKNWDQTKHFF